MTATGYDPRPWYSLDEANAYRDGYDDAMEKVEAEAASPAALDDRLRYDPTSGDPDFEDAPLSARLDAIEQAAWSKGFGEGRRSAHSEAASPAALDFDALDLAIRNAYDEYGTAGVIREYTRLTEQKDRS